MVVLEVKEGIYSVGAQHWGRKLFDELVPIPYGTSYNAFFIKGSSKNALIDTVDPTKEDELIENLKRLKIEKIDYVISNHAEQDHSGGIPGVLNLFPEAKVVTNKKCKQFLETLLHIKENQFLVINDRDTLSLGDRTLEFIFAPWVHWPETLLTYLREDKILFTCDLFSSHLATSELFSSGDNLTYEGAKRYYAGIMMPFRKNISKHLKIIPELDVEIIAPSHGPLYKNPQFILKAYKDWISDEVKNEVVIVYVSMHRSTEKIVNALTTALTERNIKVIPFNLTTADAGELAMSLIDASTLIVASPTFLVGPHPLIVYALSIVNALRPKQKFFGVIGSYGWGIGKTIDVIKNLTQNLKAEFLEPLFINGHPREEDILKFEKFADTILARHRELNIIA